MFDEMLKKRHNTTHVIVVMLAAFVFAIAVMYLVLYRHGMHGRPFLILALMIAAALFYAGFSLTIGREATVKNVESFYPPDGIDPVMADCVVDGSVSSRGIAAAFYYLAQKGYMNITEYERGCFEFEFREFPHNESNAVKMLFYAIFDIDHQHGHESGGEGHCVRLTDAAERLIKIVPKVKISAFKQINARKNRSIAEMTGRVNGFIETLLNADTDKLEETANKDDEYLFKVLPYAYAFSISTKLPSRMKNIDVNIPQWYHAYGVGEDYVFDVLYYNAMLRYLPQQLKTEVFDKTIEVPAVGRK
jgi:hypothetical protein